MKTYSVDEVAALTSEQMNQIQKDSDEEALEFIKENESMLVCLSDKEKEELKTYYTSTMETSRQIYFAFLKAFGNHHPEAIYNINLGTGNVETNQNGKRIRYSTSVIAPCTTTALRYIHGKCGQVDVVLPPMKSIERTFEKILNERVAEHHAFRSDKLCQLCLSDDDNDSDDVSFLESLSLHEAHCPTVLELAKMYNNAKRQMKYQKKWDDTVKTIRADSLVPKDIFRLSVLVKFPEQIGIIVRHLEKYFPQYIQFTERDDDQYKKKFSENKRFYFDRKKTAKLTIPNVAYPIYVEFQFKQKNMFYAHIRSHVAYEEYREAIAMYGETKNQADVKKAEAARQRCNEIHKNAVHQSNMYLMDAVAWQDDNDNGIQKNPYKSNGQFLESISMIENNYIVEDYDTPFSGAGAFTTHEDEYLNKSCYLKLIGILSENFDELGKRAKQEINKAWHSLTIADIENFHRITATAIKYQDVIRTVQQAKKKEDKVDKKEDTTIPFVSVQSER